MTSYALVEDSEEIMTDYHTSMSGFELRLKKYNANMSNISYKITADATITVLNETAKILTGKSDVIGVIGSIENMVYLKWIWDFLDCKVSQDFKKSISENYDLMNYIKYPTLYFKDPVMISYMLALIRISLEYDYILTFNIQSESNEYICIGIKNTVWV